MFCYQCEQTAKGTGCTVQGVCGKDERTAVLQDLLIYATKGIARYAHRARKLGATDPEVNAFTVEALFATITNVDFDPERLKALLDRAAAVRDKARRLYDEAAKRAGEPVEALTGPAGWQAAADIDGLVEQGRPVGILARHEQWGDDVADLHDLILFGLKGAAAYADHAHVLGYDDDAIYAEFHRLLDLLAQEKQEAGNLLGEALNTGKLNLKVTELLDKANTTTYGHPEPTKVRVTPVKGKAILISGHDLRDLELLLKQTEGKGINIYTHGEMLPCHGYPKLKAYQHLAGHFGTAWQNQQKEFPQFPGAILMTTNCIQRPQKSYAERIFTTGLVAWPGVGHIGPDKDFSPVIAAALAAPGFDEDGEEKHITVGFGHNAVMSVAPKVIELVKAGKIRHFFLIGGCDGSKPDRNYYTEFAQKVPKDAVILTLACGKFKFNRLELAEDGRPWRFGDIEGIPRLLDIGQCNDSYSAIKIASALAEAFGTDVNGLPLSFILSWYEQKAVAVLLTLLSLGIRNIRLGPSLPAFLTPNLVNILVEKFGIAPITTPDEDLKAILG
ncbi:MAG TPA: hydroxylamine reductase [candidate division WOR-3 bacterium]|uniref:Hydroxylamine reductase n=1 Tax=candidate division WOR-3 bacterium TaxID=2052148 RepID=A0A7V0XFC4_UNCW3|nr:hydroxylamine reductase [candidate division WOR-3 bacterium]